MGDSPKDKLKYVAGLAIAALLKTEGFKKEKFTWRREKKGVIDIVEFQFSTQTTNKEIQFFINYGVFDLIAYIIKNKFELKKPKEFNCQKRSSLRNARGAGRTFIIDNSTDEKRLAAELVAEIKTKILPWFELMTMVDAKYHYVIMEIAAFLRKNGFKGRGGVYRRKRGKTTDIFSVSISHGDSTQATFGFSLGKFNLKYFMEKYEASRENKPDVSQCEKRYRKSLSELKGRPRGDYKITTQTDLRKFVILVIDDIKWRAFPWFEKKCELWE